MESTRPNSLAARLFPSGAEDGERNFFHRRGETIFFEYVGVHTVSVTPGIVPWLGKVLPLAFPFSRPAFQPIFLSWELLMLAYTFAARRYRPHRLPKRVQRERDTFHVLKKILLLRTQKQPTKNLPGAKPLSVFHLASSLCDGTSLSPFHYSRSSASPRACPLPY